MTKIIDYPYIEYTDYPDRTEFRLVVLDKDPFDDKSGSFETSYAGEYKEYGTDKHSYTKFEEYCYIAYKKDNWWLRLIGRDYDNQRNIAISELSIIKNLIKKQTIKPKVGVIK